MTGVDSAGEGEGWMGEGGGEEEEEELSLQDDEVGDTGSGGSCGLSSPGGDDDLEPTGCSSPS